MYGLVIESIVAFIRSRYGDDKWMAIRKRAKIDQHAFSTHLIYAETTVPRIVEAASDVLQISREDLLIQFGNFFVTFVSQYGYDKILRVLGRHMRDFLMGLDNLHEYMRFSYPKLKPPSFFVEKENQHGLMLHYRSKRRYGGYVHYVMGQIKCVASSFYGIDVDIELLKEEFVGNTVHVIMHLRFDNSAFLTEETAERDKMDELSIESDLFFEAFPFHILFTEDMIIKSIGHGLDNVMPSIEGYDISHIFSLKRPLVDFSWEQVMNHTNNVFELESVDNVQAKGEVKLDEEDMPDGHPGPQSDSSECSEPALDETRLHLKGQMVWAKEWKGMLFLGTPVLPHLTAMFEAGLFINDLSLHDNSRDLVLAGTQTSAELKLALDQEQVKSKKLEKSMRKLDEEMRRTDELLYQMIPKQIADRLRAGSSALDTCQVFDDVTMLFSDVVGFTVICSRISPLQVVTMLNSMYSKFDHLCSQHDTYKVETIGDAYVVVAGAPEEVADHAQRIANMAIGMVETMPTLVDPSTDSHLEIRVGINSGVVVAGVVGLKMPRYCLFGDTVNTAAKMESSSERMKIQMSEATHRHLKDDSNYTIVYRGVVDIKDKGKMNTYWLSASDSYAPHIRTLPTANETFLAKKIIKPAMVQPIPSSISNLKEIQSDTKPVWSPTLHSQSSFHPPLTIAMDETNSLPGSSAALLAPKQPLSEPEGSPEDPLIYRGQRQQQQGSFSLEGTNQSAGQEDVSIMLQRKRPIYDSRFDQANLTSLGSSSPPIISGNKRFSTPDIHSPLTGSCSPSTISSSPLPLNFSDSSDDMTLRSPQSAPSAKSSGRNAKSPVFDIRADDYNGWGMMERSAIGVATRPVLTDLPQDLEQKYFERQSAATSSVLPARVSSMYKSGPFKALPQQHSTTSIKSSARDSPHQPATNGRNHRKSLQEEAKQSANGQHNMVKLTVANGKSMVQKGKDDGMRLKDLGIALPAGYPTSRPVRSCACIIM